MLSTIVIIHSHRTRIGCVSQWTCGGSDGPEWLREEYCSGCFVGYVFSTVIRLLMHSIDVA